MAPKRKPSKPGDGDPDLFDEFLKRYARLQKEFDTPKLIDAQEYISKQLDEGDEVLSWNFSREFDPVAFRVLFQSFTQAGYNKLKAIRVWRCRGGDEAVRSVCSYLDSCPMPDCEDLQFTDNGVTALGCEFLAHTLGPTGQNKVNLLRLDYNQIGTPGVEKLSVGLSQNATLRHLALMYCGIGEEGGMCIGYMIMYIKSVLEKLELRGNFLQSRGVTDVFRAVRRSATLRSIDVFDNKFSDTPELIEVLRELFEHNQKLDSYNLGGNHLSDTGATALVQGMVGHTHLKEVFVPERCSGKTFEALEFQLNSGKGKKKRGKKKGK